MGAVPIADWEWIMGINLWGVIYGCHVFVPRFKQQRRGHVINVASAAGLLSAGEMGPYNMTKAGVVALSETLASELRTLGVGVTVVCPTFFRTNIGKSSRSTNNDGARALVERLMDRAKIQPDGVARIALETADRDELYAVPHADGQWMRGYVTFAQTAAPSSRTTQLFVNLGNNARLDNMRFAPFAVVIAGMDVVDLLNAEYGAQPDQAQISAQGNAHLNANFPRLEYIVTAQVR